MYFISIYHPYESGNVIRNQSPNIGGCRGNNFSRNICLFFSNGSLNANEKI